MALHLAEVREFLGIATEALGRYKLRTSLSVLGVVLGVAAVIAMMSVSEGAAREALTQVESLGLDNLVARNHSSSAFPGTNQGLSAGDVERVLALVPLAQAASPLIERFVRVSHADKSVMTRVLGVTAEYQAILRLGVDRGRFITAVDESQGAAICVIGTTLAHQLFGFRDAIGESIRVGTRYYKVVGTLRDAGGRTSRSGSMAWRNLSEVALVPLPALSARTTSITPGQPVDEIWLQASDGERAEEIGKVFSHTLTQLHGGRKDFDLIVPRELLAQRYRTQRTFSVVVGSVAALALLIGGIGIMNIMLTSVVERTREIGVRRTVGATRRDVTVQFLVETLLMTVSGGTLGIVIGAAVSWGITAYAGWATRISPLSVVLGFFVSVLVGLIFGLYPAIKAANLEPVDAMRYE
jgi:putative ABC transport system permease protein